ncbi:hypothetical protein [Plantactinospora sonchi]|uniref:Sensor domain-containing protein n=1 Tax=Plantactinospora sonchi TaxID=1544735 RepID=A0ABU7RYG6_9ACTN
MRRTRLQAPVAVALGLIMLAGCTTDSGVGPAATGGPSTTPATPAAAATSPSSSTPSPSPGTTDVIAGSALLQPEDLNGARLEPVPDGESAHLRPARPCDARYPSDRTRTAAVAMRAYVSQGDGYTSHVVLQYVGLHPGHAETAFDEIVDAVRQCPGSLGTGQQRWEVAGTGVAGDESLLLRVSERFNYGDDVHVVTTPAVIARVGDHVTVVADLGWENAGGSEPELRLLAAKAVERLRAAR